MARIYAPRELIKDGKPSGLWHMTVASDEENWPAYAVGACSRSCAGHPTPADAYSHWRMGQVETGTFDASWRNWMGCEVPGCDRPTKDGARIEAFDGHAVALCKEHLNRDGLRAALKEG